MSILKSTRDSANVNEPGFVSLASIAEAIAGLDATKAMTPAATKAVIDALIDGAPGALDTLNELAAAISDDENFATTVQNQLTNLQNQINSVSGGGASNQIELDDTQLGAGLDVNGNYVQDSSTTYIAGATSLANADSLLDAQVAANAAAISSLGGASLSALQAEVDAIEASSGLNSDGSLPAFQNVGGGNLPIIGGGSPATSLKDALHMIANYVGQQSFTGSNDLSDEVVAHGGEIDALNTLQTAQEAAIGLSAAGGYVSRSGTNYLDSASSIVGEITALDTQVKSNEDDIAQNTTDIATKASSSALSTLQSEVDATQAGVGLASDGTYSAISGANYATSSSSLKAAVTQLDTQAKTNADDIAALGNGSFTTLQGEVDDIEASVGLATDGSLGSYANNNNYSASATIKAAIEGVDAQVATNTAAIAGLGSSSAITALQSEVDATQSGAGLSAAGAYTAPSSSNYLGSASSLADADDKLDAQIKTNADAIASNDSDITGLQSELDATQAGSGLSTAGAYVANSSTNYLASASSLKNADELLDARIATNASDISALSGGSGLSGIQSELDATQAAAGLATNGTFSANSSGSYISSATSIRGEINALDSQLSNTQSDLDTAEASLASLTTTVGNKADSSTVSSLQSEVDATQTGVGLNANGSYSAHTSSNYINSATSVKSALGLLDAQVSTNETDIASLNSTVSTLTAGSGATSGQITVLQNEIDATQAGAGLSTSGAYTAPGSSNYLGSASSLKDADDKLDAQIKTNADAIVLKAAASDLTALTTRVTTAEGNITSNDSDISSLQSDVSSNTSDISTNTSDISTLQSGKASTTQLSALQSEVDATQAGAGLSSAGAYSADSSTNYITSATSLKNADFRLDAQIKANADAIASNDTDIATNAAAISGLASNSTITAMQTEIDAIETGVGLASDGSYTAISGNYATASSLRGAVSQLDTQVALNASAILSNDGDISTLQSDVSSNDSDISSLQTLANTHESSIGLETDGSYAAISGANYASSSSSLKAAVAQLDTQLKTTQDEVDAEETARASAISTVNSSISTLQSEVDATQTGAGLTSAGGYTANTGANYIDSASSLKDADDKLDTQIKTNADNIASNTSDISSNTSDIATKASSSSVSALQSEVDTSQASIGLNTNGSYTALTGNYNTASTIKGAISGVDTQVKTNADAIASNDTDIASNVSAINTIEASVGLSSAGAYVSRSGSNYLDSASSVVGESSLLDAQIKTNADAIATKASTSSLNTLQTEVDAIETAAGLSSSGAYVTHSGSNYMDSATTMKGAREALDTQVKTNADAISSESSSRQSADNTLTTAINTVEASVGLQADGSLSISGTNFLNSSGTIVAALDTLDTNQKLLSDIRLNMISAIGLSTTGTKNNYANTNYISNSEDLIESVEALDRQIASNASSISSLGSGNIANLQSELDDTQSGAGLGTDGSYSANSSTNYLTSVSSLKAADEALDTQIKTNADNIALKANSTTLSALDLRVTQLEIGDGGILLDHASDDAVEMDDTISSFQSKSGPFQISLASLVSSGTTDLVFFGSKGERDGDRHFAIHPTSGDAIFAGKHS